MSRAQKMFNKPTLKHIQPDKVNFDGFPAFSVSIYEQYVQMVMVNTIGNTYYVDSKELFEYSLDLHDKMKNEDPSFMAKAIVYARNAGLMRMQPIIGLAYLSTLQNKNLFSSSFNKVIKTPGDLTDFVSIVGSVRKGKGLGRSVKRAINSWLVGRGRKEGLSQYHAIKYGGKSGNKWTLSGVIKECHPIPENDYQSNLFKYLTRGERNRELNQIEAIEQLKILSSQKSEISDRAFTDSVKQLIQMGRLPYEIVTGIVKPNREIWEFLMYQMPIFALVRHLSTLEDACVFNDRKNVDGVVEKLKNPDIILNSRMLPFRFSTAYNNFKGNTRIRNALKDALDLSLSNINMIPGKNAIFLDVSGSMNKEFLEIGSLLGLAALKKSVDSKFLCFSTELKLPDIDIRESVMTNMKKCFDMYGGGTAISICIDYLLGAISKAKKQKHLWFDTGYSSQFPESEKTDSPIKVDNIIIITDEEQNSGSPLINRFRQYRKNVNKNAKLFIIDISPYDSRVANENEPGVTFIYGWNDTVLSILQHAIKGFGSHVNQIKLEPEIRAGYINASTITSDKLTTKGL